MTHEHKPAAAFDLFSIIAGSNSGFDKQSFLTTATFPGGNSPELTIYLNPKRAAINAFGSFINFWADFQLESFGFFEFLSKSTYLQKEESNHIVAAKTYGTPAGGFANDLATWKSFLSIEFNAYQACLTKGPAALSFS